MKAGNAKVMTWMLAAALCSGCSSLPQESQAARVPTGTLVSSAAESPLVEADRRSCPGMQCNVTDSPVGYLIWISALDAQAVMAEKRSLEARIEMLDAEADCSIDCTRLALLLGTSSVSDHKESGRALALLGRALAAEPEEPLQEAFQVVARLWRSHMQALLQVESLTRQRNEQARFIETLEKQIEELTAIEKQLIEREELPPP